MTIVLDANVAVALALDAERAPAIERHLRAWEEAGETLHAPSLFRFEVANALARCSVVGTLAPFDARTAWERIIEIEITLHELQDGPFVINIAQKLKRQSAYDAAYLALAVELEAVLWTLDGPLARNATGAKLPVRLIDTGG